MWSGRLSSPLVGALALLAACAPPAPVYDFDDDGSLDVQDCDPQDPAIHPDAEDDHGDGVDQNCDGLDGVDGDADGFASETSGGDDCNDRESHIHPGAEETPDNGIDEDCSGSDLVCDLDGDGLTVAECGGLDCDDTNPECALDCLDGDGDGFAVCQGDCDDGDDGLSPDADEVCDGIDDDCDGELLAIEVDGDGDGAIPCGDDPDCDDGDPLRAPGLLEVCDGLDNDCDGATWAAGGEQDADADGDPACLDCVDTDPGLNLHDLDGDHVTTCAGDCDDSDPSVWPGAPDGGLDHTDDNCDGVPGVDGDHDGEAGTATGGLDCDDHRPDVHTGAPELCDGIDNDCDGAIDEDFDLDGDAVTTCDGDCDDSDATVAPSSPELCDGIDNDCDGLVPTAEVDADGDGAPACDDCDDADPATHPAAAEACDGADQNCDGGIDEGFDIDADGVTSCGGDCLDDNPYVRPGEAEVCDGFDTDCDPATEPAAGELDGDGDGHLPCSAWVDHGGVSVGGDDCDDTEPSVHPGAVELCDGLDGDCDPGVSAAPSEADVDADGHLPCGPYVDAGATNTAGLPLVGGDDCDDLEPARNPSEAEVCDGLDNDCDAATQVASGEEDADADRHLPCSGFVDHGATNALSQVLLGGDDCDETAPLTFPGNPEVCDGIDNDCDPATPPGGPEDDADGDRYLACSDFVARGLLNAAGQELLGGLDCDDGDASQVPGAWEDPDDGQDSSCDGLDSTSVAWAGVQLTGEAPYDSAGGSVAGRGDVDGDGLADILVGARTWERGPDTGGAAAIFLGASLQPGVELDLSDAWALLHGEAVGVLAGTSVAWAGDVDGDGLDDVLVEADWPGRTYLVLGGSLTPGERSLADAHAVIEDPPFCLRAPVGVGDVDGDGLDDVALDGCDWGVHLFLGSDLASGGDFAREDAWAVMETAAPVGSVAAAGDVDGDGLADVLVGDPQHDDAALGPNCGRAWLWHGATLAAGGTLPAASADVTFLAEAGGDSLGTGLASAGDLDGDGLSDLLLSAPARSELASLGGQVYVVLAAQLPTSGTFAVADAHAALLGSDPVGYLGEGTLTGGGDVDGDGIDDVVVGSPDDDEVGERSGKAWFFSGAALAAGGDMPIEAATAAFAGEAEQDRVGWAVDLVADVDGDGRWEVLVGSAGNDQAGANAGKVSLLEAPP